MDLQNILNGNLFKVWFKFVSASVVGVLLNTLYTMVDGIFVGQGAGEAGLAGVNIAWPAVAFIIGIGSLFGAGGSTLISVYLGRHDKVQSEKLLGTVLKTVLLIGSILMLIGFFLANYIPTMLGAHAETFQPTKDYFMIIYLFAIPYLLSNTLNPIVRSDGNPHLSMIMVAVGAVSNIILDWIFVIKWGMGTRGAALATGLGVIISTLIGLWYFLKGKSYIKFHFKYFKFDFPILKEVSKVGLVSFMIQLSIGLVIFLQNNIIYTYGTTSDIAIFCVAGYIISLYTQLCVGISQGMQPLIGYHYGAELKARMHKLLKLTLIVSVASGVLALLSLVLGGHSFIRLYGITEELIPLAYTRTMIFCIGAPCIGIIYTMSAYYQAIGCNLEANIISIGRGFVLQAAFSIILPLFIGVEGIFYAQSVSDFGALFILLAVILYQKRKKHLA